MTTVYICGDSTAASYGPERAPSAGWGQALQPYLRDGVTVSNEAAGGRSTKSFIGEGRLVSIEARLQPDDLLLIQFTHNDASDLIWRHTDPWGAFAHNLAIFVDTARLRGAKPVLLTPICRRHWDFETEALLETHGAYPDAVRHVAAAKNVPLIDHLAQTTALVNAQGYDESKALFMYIAPGQYPAFPDGVADGTHTSQAGAKAFAGLVADGLRALGAPYDNLVRQGGERQ